MKSKKYLKSIPPKTICKSSCGWRNSWQIYLHSLKSKTSPGFYSIVPYSSNVTRNSEIVKYFNSISFPRMEWPCVPTSLAVAAYYSQRSSTLGMCSKSKSCCAVLRVFGPSWCAQQLSRLSWKLEFFFFCGRKMEVHGAYMHTGRAQVCVVWHTRNKKPRATQTTTTASTNENRLHIFKVKLVTLACRLPRLRCALVVGAFVPSVKAACVVNLPACVCLLWRVCGAH